MDGHPDSALPSVQFERARLSTQPQMPVTRARLARQLALVADGQSSPMALGQRLIRGQIQVGDEHVSA
jgi:hypothetical protein